MVKTTPAHATPLRDQLEKLAAFEAQELPFLSLYLNLTPNQQGRDNYDIFTRKVFAERRKAFQPRTAHEASFNRDVDRITAYLAEDVNRSTSGVAIFACAGANEFFEAIQLQAPVDEHWLFVGPTPHLYPLAQAVDRFPRYAAVVTDTNHARILVFSLGEVEQRREVTGVKTKRTSVGGWSQARYQRRAENFHLHHVKEVVETLNRIVTDEHIPHVIIAGDDVVVPLVKEQLPQTLIDKLVDTVQLDVHVAEDELLRRTLDALHQKDAETDAELVQEAIGAWQGNGLGTVGPEGTLQALTMGQVDQLLITGAPQELKPVQTLPSDSPGEVTADTSLPAGPGDPQQVDARGRIDRPRGADRRARAVHRRSRAAEGVRRRRRAAALSHLDRRIDLRRRSQTVSRANKVNKDRYTMAGRLTPDDLARERMRQMHVTGRASKDKPMPPWMTRPSAPAEPAAAEDVFDANAAQEASEPASSAEPTAAKPPARKAAARKVAVKKPAAKKAAAKKAASKKRAAKKSPANTAARRASPSRQGRAAARTGRTTGTGITRQKQKKRAKKR